MAIKNAVQGAVHIENLVHDNYGRSLPYDYRSEVDQKNAERLNSKNDEIILDYALMVSELNEYTKRFELDSDQTIEIEKKVGSNFIVRKENYTFIGHFDDTLCYYDKLISCPKEMLQNLLGEWYNAELDTDMPEIL